MSEQKAKKQGFFFGWVVVAATFIIMMCNAGTAIYGFSLFVAPVTKAFGFQTTSFVLGMTITTIVAALLSPLVGQFLGKRGLKTTVVVGAVFFGIGFTVLSFAKVLPIFYLGYFFVGLGSSFTGPIIGSTVATRWFSKYRGTATGITSAGIGIGSMVLAPIISKIIVSYGFSKAYLFMACLDVVVIILMGVIFLKDSPATMGLFPDGAKEAQEARSINLEGLTSKEAMSTKAFWLIGLGIMLYSCAQFGILQTQNPHLQSLSFSPELAAKVVAIVGLVGSVSKLLFGVLSDTIPLKVATAIGFLFQAGGAMLLWSFTAGTSTTMIYVYCIIFGLGLGCWQPLLSKHLSDSFGVLHFPAIFGSIFLIKAMGDTIGPISASLVKDNSGFYNPAYVVFAALTIVAIVLFSIYRKPSKQ